MPILKVPIVVGRIEKKISKAGKEYNLVWLKGMGFSFSTFLPEELVPDMLEGVEGEVHLRIDFKGWKPEFRIVGFKKGVQ